MTIDIYFSTDYIQVPIIKQSKMYLNTGPGYLTSLFNFFSSSFGPGIKNISLQRTQISARFSFRSSSKTERSIPEFELKK